MKNKMKAFTRQLSHLSGISRSVLILGQAVIFAISASVLIYLVTLLTGHGDALITYERTQSIKYMLECIAAGLCVLWGGALFIDFALKKKEEETQ